MSKASSRSSPINSSFDPLLEDVSISSPSSASENDNHNLYRSSSSMFVQQQQHSSSLTTKADLSPMEALKEVDAMTTHTEASAEADAVVTPTINSSNNGLLSSGDSIACSGSLNGDESDGSTFEVSVEEEEKVVAAAIMPPSAAATENGSKDSRNSARSLEDDKKSKKALKTSSSSSSNSIQPLVINTPPNIPLGIDIDMIMPLVSWVQPSSPLVGHVTIGDILVFVDGKSTAELSHGMLTKMLNSTKEKGGGGGKGRTLIFLPGRYRKNLISADQGTDSSSDGTAASADDSGSSSESRRTLNSSKENGRSSDITGKSNSSSKEEATNVSASLEEDDDVSLPMTEDASDNLTNQRNYQDIGGAAPHVIPMSPEVNSTVFASRAASPSTTKDHATASSKQPAAIHRKQQPQTTATAVSPESTSLTQQIILPNQIHNEQRDIQHIYSPSTDKRLDSASSKAVIVSPTATNITFDTTSDHTKEASSLNSHKSFSQDEENSNYGENNIIESTSTPKRKGNGSASDGILGISPPQYHPNNNLNNNEEDGTESDGAKKAGFQAGLPPPKTLLSSPQSNVLLQTTMSSSAPSQNPWDDKPLLAITPSQNLFHHTSQSPLLDQSLLKSLPSLDRKILIPPSFSRSNSEADSSQSDVVSSINKSLITEGGQQTFVTCKSMEQSFHTCQSEESSHDDDDDVVGDELKQTHPADQSLLQMKDTKEQQRQAGGQEDDHVNSTVQSSLQSSGPKKQQNKEEPPNNNSDAPTTDSSQKGDNENEEQQEEGQAEMTSSGRHSSYPMTEQASSLPTLQEDEQKEPSLQSAKEVTKQQQSSPPPPPSSPPEDIMDDDEKRRLERRNRPPPTFDYIMVNSNTTDNSAASTSGDVSTIYGGRWNPALHDTAANGHCRRLEDRLGYMEGGYLGGYSVVQSMDGGSGSANKYDPNTYSQLHLLGLNTTHQKQYERDAMMRKTKQEEQQKAMKEENLKQRLRKEQHCVEGVLVSLIVLSVVALVVVLVVVLRDR